MKNSFHTVLAILILSIVSVGNVQAQNDYKHPHLNASGIVLDSAGNKLGWIKNRIIYDAKGEKIGKIENAELFDSKGHRLGNIGKDGTFYDETGALVFTIETTNKGEKCKVFDPQGKVIATVHAGYKNQACAIHCLYKKMPPH